MFYSVYGSGDAPLKIDMIGYTDDPKISRFGPARRNQYIIHYVLDGKGTFNGAPVKKGQGFLITPNTFQKYYPDKNEPWRYIWFISTDKTMEQIFPLFQADPNTQVFSFPRLHEMENMVLKIKSNQNRIVERCVLLEWFLSVFNSHNAHATTQNRLHREEYIRFAIEYIENNIYQPISIQTLTRLLGVSQPYLYTIFKEQFSVSPKQYLTQRKLYHAKKMLADTNLSISEISRSVGFEDVLAFSKFFSKNEGVSPSRFRNEKK